MVPDEQEQEEEQLPETVIERARSGRSKCKGCRKAIAKDDLRLGVLVEGPYGLGHMWFHLTVLPRVALEACQDPEVTTAPEDLVKLLRENSRIDAARLEEAIGELG